MKKFAIVLLILGIVETYGNTPLIAGSKGTTGAEFLKIGLGARAVGMGEAVSGVVDGVEGLFWNPGGLSRLNKIEATFMRLEYFEGINLNNLAYGQRIKDYGVVGVFVESLDIGSIGKTEVDSLGNLIDRGNSFKASNLAIGVGYSNNLGERQAVGAVVKSIQGKIDNESGTSYALDLGWIYDLRDNLRLGAALQNLGSKLKYVSEGDKLPFRVRVGAGYKIIQGLIVSADIVDEVNESRYNLNLGAEYNFRELASVRVGYNTDRVSSLGGSAGLSVGAGFKYLNYSLDYGFVPYGDLGDSHRISLGVTF